MKTQSFIESLLKYLRAIGILTAINLILMGLICLIGGWRTWLDYSNSLMYSAGLLFIIGGLSLMGNRKSKNRLRIGHIFSSDLEIDDMEDSEEVEIKNKNFKFFLIMEISGVVSIAASVIVGVTAGL